MPSMDQAFSSKGGFSFLVAKTDPFVADGAVALCRFQPVSEMPVNIHFVSVLWVPRYPPVSVCRVDPLLTPPRGWRAVGGDPWRDAEIVERGPAQRPVRRATRG